MASTYTLITSQTLSSSAASVTFSSIPSTYTDLVLLCSVRDTATTANTGRALLTVNGDNTTNYSWTDLWAFPTTSTNFGSGRGTSTSSIDPNQGSGDATGNTTSTFSSIEFYLSNYTSTTSRAIGIKQATETNAAGAWISNVAGLYRGTSAITSTTLTARTAFDTGSSFYLYGIKNS